MADAFYAYPSIGQFANAVRHVKSKTRFSGLDKNRAPIYNTNELPTIKYRGTVKLHGTNAAIVYDTITQCVTFQSRERILTLYSDNAGFMLHMLSKTLQLIDIFKYVYSKVSSAPNKVVIYGEWCGGNIQSGVGLNGLDKMFVIFGIKLVRAEANFEWVDMTGLSLDYPELGIYNALSFPVYELEIDFENPGLSQNTIVDLVNAVETECPVAKHFGNIGIGEGIVWAPKTMINDSGYWFKTKGEKHSVSKVKTIAPVDVEAIESINKFVETYVTENRMEQMLDAMVREKLLPFDMKNLGDFIRLVYQDVLKETALELSENNINPKKVGSSLSIVARRWYIDKFNKL